MKPHLPHKLLAVLMATCVAPVSYATETGNSAPATDLGNVMYVGDSITHGVNSASWRWAMHKIFVDNGLEYSPVGYKTGNDSGGVANGTTYCGEAFANVHSAQSSARAWEISGRNAGTRFNGTKIQNWLGQETTKTGGGAYTGATYDVDTFYLLIGTNDLLSDGGAVTNATNLENKTTNLLGAADSNGVRSGGDMKTILDAMYAEKSDTPVTILSIPCWTRHKNSNEAAYHAAVQSYNEELKAWVDNYNATNGTDALLVDVNKGMVDVASSTPFYGCESMFGNPGSDGLHPSAHGDLIMAGAVAKAQGYAGRTAGQLRMDASEFAHQADDFTLTGATLADGNITIGNNGTAVLDWTDGVALDHGFTVDFSLPDGLGNGATDGWSNGNLAITMGNGVIGGTLNISEAYIKWGDTVLYSLDMSGNSSSSAYTVFNTAESIRVAYVIGNTEANLSSGFYVWMDDMLIGEACGITGTNVKGVSITNGTGSSLTLGGLAATEHAYAPTTTRTMVSNNVIAPYIPDVSKDVATKSWNSDGATSVNMGGGIATTAQSNIIIGSGSTGTISLINANSAPTGGATWIDVTGAAVCTGFSQIVGNGATHTGNVNYRIDDAYQNTTTWGSLFGTNNGKVDGNLYMEFSGATVNITNGAYNGVSASVAGGYQSNGVTGAMTMVFNAGTFGGGIWGGSINTRGDFGSTGLHVFGGSFGGDIHAGGTVGTISGDTSIILTGDAYELTGGSKTISAGGTGGTIQGGTTLTIKDMGTDDSADAKGIAHYAGNLTLSGNDGATVTGQKKLAFINSTHNDFSATLSNFDVVELTESTLQINGGLGGATALKLDKDSSLTLNAGTYGEMQVASSGSITLKGGSSMTLSQTNNDSQISGTFEVQQASALGMGAGYNTQSTYTIKDGAMLSMANGATLLGGGTINLEAGSAVNVVEGATATIQGTLTGDLNLAGPGALVLDEGTETTINSLRGGALLNQGSLTIGDIGPLNSTLINSGDLTITGHISMPQNLSKLTHMTYGVESAAGAAARTIGYAAGEVVSGYYNNIYFLIGSDEEGTVDFQGTADSGIQVDESFVYVLATDYSTYHLNEDATYSTHDAYNVTTTGSTLQVEDGFTLTLDRSVQSGVKLATVGDGAVNLNSGTTEISLGTGAATLQNVYVGEGNEATVAHSTVESTGIRVDDGGLLHVNVTNTNLLNFNISKLSGEGTVELSNSTNNNVIFSGANAPAGFNGTLVLDGKSWNCFDGTAWNFTEIDGKYASLHINAGGRGMALGNYKTEAGALNIGNLSGAGAISPSYGDAGSHYLAVHQNKDTIYSGSAQKDSTRNISILKYGESNLILSGNNTSDGALKVKKGTVTFTPTGSWAGATTVENGATLAFIDGDKNYNGANTTFETGSMLRVLGAGTLADTEFAAGNLTFASDASISKLIVDEGASATVNANTTLTIGATMQIDGMFTNNGTLAVTSLANLDAVGGTQYTDRISPTSGNGYETAVYSVYTGSGTMTGNKAITIAGTSTSYEIDSAGQVRVGESSGRYFINQGSVVYGGADNVAASDTTQFLVLNGGTLELAQSLRDGHTLSLAVDNATLRIRDGVVQNLVTVNRPGATLTLAGDGVYHIGNRQTLNDQVVMGDDWTGAIAISGYFDGLNVQDLAKDGSRVRFTGVNGWLVKAYSTIARDVELADDGDTPALNVTGMSTSFAYGFTGKVSGNGTIKFSGGGHSNQNDKDLVFTGDISGWTGKFEEAGTDGDRSIKFSNSATNINAAVEHTGTAAFKVKIDNNNTVAVNNSITNAQGAGAMTLALTGTGAKTFAESVVVTTLTTAGGAATFDGSLNADTLTADADVTISSTANATLGNVNVNAGTLTLNGTTEMTGTLANSGTVALGANANTTFNNVTMNTGSSMTFAAGSTVTVNGTLQTSVDIDASNAAFTGGTFTKSGAGTLTLDSTANLSNTTVSGGTLVLKSVGGHTYGDITLNGGNLALNVTDTKNATFNSIHSLTLGADSAISSTNYRAHLDIQSLSLNGHTLTLDDRYPNANISKYLIGGDYAGSGKIIVNQPTSTATSHVAVGLTGEHALRDAVISFETANRDGTWKTLAVSAPRVEIAGLESGSSTRFTNNATLISLGITSATSNTINPDSDVRTLAITGDGQTHTYYGIVRETLNIEMGTLDTDDQGHPITEAGSTQVFAGTTSAFNGSITVNKGTLTFNNVIGSTPSIDVLADGTLNLAGGTTAALNVAGALNLTSGTLTVNNVLALADGGAITNNGTLALGANSLIDLTGLEGEAVGDNCAYRILAEGSTGAVTGLDSLSLSRIRANGIGWESASYADGVITLVRSGAVLEWNTTNAFTWTQTDTPTGFHPIGGAADATQASTATSSVSFNETTAVTLGENITVAGLGVDENKHLTVTANSHTLNAKTINLENGSTLTIDNAALDYTGTTQIDLSTGSTLELTGAALPGYDHQIFTGDGELKLALLGTENNHYNQTVKTGKGFTGTIHITSGYLTIAGSVASTGATTWELDDGVNAVLSSGGTNTLSTNIKLGGHSLFHVNSNCTTNFYGNITGSSSTADSYFDKVGGGALNFFGEMDVKKLKTSGGGDFNAGVSSSVTIDSFMDNTNSVTISGKFVGGANFYKTGAGTLTFNSSADITLPMLDIQGGSVVIKTSSQDLSIGTVKLANGRTLTNYSEGYPVREVAVSQLTLTGTSATSTLKTDYFGGTWKVGGLTLAGNTLTLEAAHASNAWSIYNFTGTQTANDTGVIKVQQTNNGTERCVLVRVAGNDVLRGTELVASKIVTSWRQNNQTKTSDTNYIVFALASGDVEMRGLSAVSSDDLAESALSRVVLVSNTCDLVGTGRTSDNAFWQTAGDGIARTLTLTGTGGVDIYSGVVGSNIHIVMGNATTAAGSHQKFMGNITAFNGDVTVNKGQLTFGNALSTTGTVTVNGGTLTNDAALTAAGVTLNGGTATVGGLLTTGPLAANGGSIAINGGATVSGLTGTGASISAATAQNLTITGEGDTYAGGIGANVNIVMADTATGTQVIGGSMANFNGDVTVNAGTLQISSGATVGTLTLAEGAAITDSGTLSVGTLSAVAGSAINNTNLVYTGTVATNIAAAMEGSSLEVTAAAGKVTLSGAPKNLVNLTIDTSNNEDPTDDILLDTDVTVSDTISLGNNAQIGFGNNRQLSWEGFTYTTDGDGNTKGTISKAGEGSAVTVSNMRIMSTKDEAHSIEFTLNNVRLVNTAGTATLTATGNTLSDVVISGGKVVLAENTIVTNDVNLAVQSAQLEVAAGKTLTNGVVTLKGANNKALLIDNTTANASVFYGNGEASAAIITGAEVTVNAAAAPDQSYTWGAQLVGSSLTVTGGSLTLHNSEMHQITSFSINPQATLTLKNGCAMDYLTGTYEANMEGLDGTIHNGHTARETMNLNCASTTVSNMTITLTSKSDKNFYMGVQNVDLVRDYADASALVVQPDWVKNDAKNFRNIEAKQGEINFAGHAFAKGDVIVGGTGSVTVNDGKVLKVDNDVITITGTSAKAKITADTAGSTLAGADATAKVSDATLAVNNTGSETYTWGAKLENSSLTTSGDVKLTNSNSVTNLTLNAGSNLTLTGDMTAGTVSIANGATLNVVNAELKATSLSGGTLNLTDIPTSGQHVGVVEGEGTGELKALMAGCTLETTDVVVNASSAIDAVALKTENFMGKTFTLDIFSTLKVGDDVTLTLAGIENYSDVKLYWSILEQPANGAAPALLLSGADGDAYSMDYAGKVTLTDLEGVQHGTVVNVWATAVVPEPTTGALSVLALAALAARRRRKH